VKKILLLFLAVTITFTTIPFKALANSSNYQVLIFEITDEEIINNIESRVNNKLLFDFNADLTSEELEALVYSELFFYLEPDEQIFSTTTLADDFEDNSVVIILNRTTSRDNRTFTSEDFGDIGALYVQDLDRLSEVEYEYAKALWEAERNIVLAEHFSAFTTNSRAEIQQLYMAYLEIREAAEENTLVDFDEYRRILLVRLNQNCKENVLNVIKFLQERDDVYWVGPNFITRQDEDELTELSANITPFSSAWAHNLISTPAAHRITRGTPNIRVGILGSAIQTSHNQLIGRVRIDLSGVFSNIQENMFSFTFGTQQAGIIGGRNIGIAPNVDLVQLVAVDMNGDLVASAAISALTHARNNGIRIINHSFHVDRTNIAFRNSVMNYTGLFVNVAGNNLGNTDSWPFLPGLDNVLNVGASDQNDRARWYSSWGRTSVHLFAPSGVQTAFPNNTYGIYPGTSAAAPHVAGVAALVLSANPNLSPSQLRNIILESVDAIPLFADHSVSGGRLNAYSAVRGATANRWTSINSNWYYFNNRMRRTGWFRYDNNYYFLNPMVGASGNATNISLGQMRTGWVRNGGWYFLNPRPGEPGRTGTIPQGAMRTGWLNYHGDWYFLNTPRGRANHNPSLHEGQMFTGTHIIDSQRFTFNNSGVCTVGPGC